MDVCWVEAPPMGSWEVAVLLAARAVDARPDLVDGWLRLAHAQEQAGKPHQAAEVLEKALERFPDNSALYGRLVRVWQLLHDFERAFDAQARWQLALPEDPEARYRLFLLLVRAQRLDEAVDFLGEVAARFPDAPGVVETIFRRALDDGGFDAVIEHCDRVLEIDPGHVDGLFFKA